MKSLKVPENKVQGKMIWS